MVSEAQHFFETYGSFPVQIVGRKFMAPGAEWWTNLEDDHEGLSSAIGCYAFVLRRGQKITPWYVGKTISSFRNEVFTPHKINHYKDIVSENSGNPAVFLFPLMTGPFAKDWRFAKGRSHAGLVSWLERTLIGMAYTKNPAIKNAKDATFLRSVAVRGIIGEFLGRPDECVKEARSAFLHDR